MKMKSLLIAALLAGTSPPAMAQDISLTAGMLREILQKNPEIVVEALQLHESNQRAASVKAMNERVALNADALFSTDGIPWIGSAEPDVEIVVFSDYRCPHCMANEQAMLEVIASDPGVRFIQRELPILGPESTLAASYALAVFEMDGIEAYQEVNASIFAREGRVGIDWIEEHIDASGRNREAVLAMMQSEAVSADIMANLELARIMEINGTPFMAVDGVAVPGSLSADNMRRLISEARARR